MASGDSICDVIIIAATAAASAVRGNSDVIDADLAELAAETRGTCTLVVLVSWFKTVELVCGSGNTGTLDAAVAGARMTGVKGGTWFF